MAAASTTGTTPGRPGTADLAVHRPDLRPELDPTPLAVCRYQPGVLPDALPAALAPGFCALVAVGAEVTLVCPEEALSRPPLAGCPAAEVEPGWRRVTFPGPLPWELVGFLADVAGRLAAAQIPFTSMSGFTTDHVLVRAAQAELAVSVLSGRPAPPQRPGTNP